MSKLSGCQVVGLAGYTTYAVRMQTGRLSRQTPGVESTA